DAHGLPVVKPKVSALTLPSTDAGFESLVKKTYKQMLAGPSGCGPCISGSPCGDSLFCNGVEICQSGHCAAGAAPCVDANPCTNDVCTENTDTCSHPA